MSELIVPIYVQVLVCVIEPLGGVSNLKSIPIVNVLESSSGLKSKKLPISSTIFLPSKTFHLFRVESQTGASVACPINFGSRL